MLNDKSGQRVPQVTFKTRQKNEWLDVTTEQLFANKTVVVFSLPGAFTPTCSATHLPRYNELAGVLKANGVDDIVCISVNDAFVMNAWLADQAAENITVIPDGNGEFTKGLGLEMDASGFGMGTRGQRFALIVERGTVTAVNIEAPGALEVSSAEYILNQL